MTETHCSYASYSRTASAPGIAATRPRPDTYPREGFGRGSRYALPVRTGEGSSLVGVGHSLVSEASSLVGTAAPELPGQASMETLIDRVRGSQRAPRAVVEQAILGLCSGRFVALAELAGQLNRSPQRLRAYIGKLVERGEVELRFPDSRNHPQQACRTAATKATMQ